MANYADCGRVRPLDTRGGAAAWHTCWATPGVKATQPVPVGLTLQRCKKASRLLTRRRSLIQKTSTHVASEQCICQHYGNFARASLGYSRKHPTPAWHGCFSRSIAYLLGYTSRERNQLAHFTR